MPDPLLWTAAAFLAGAFAWAALAKALHWSSWRAALGSQRLSSPLENVVALAVPVVEAATAAVLLAGSMGLGAAAALFLMAVFSAAIIRARSLQGDRLPCGCFGQLRERDYRLMLVRNGILAALAGVVLLASPNEGLLFEFEAPAPGDVVPGVLVALGVGLIAWMARQVASSMRRGEQP